MVLVAEKYVTYERGILNYKCIWTKALNFIWNRLKFSICTSFPSIFKSISHLHTILDSLFVWFKHWALRRKDNCPRYSIYHSSSTRFRPQNFSLFHLPTFGILQKRLILHFRFAFKRWFSVWVTAERLLQCLIDPVGLSQLKHSSFFWGKHLIYLKSGLKLVDDEFLFLKIP